MAQMKSIFSQVEQEEEAAEEATRSRCLANGETDRPSAAPPRSWDAVEDTRLGASILKTPTRRCNRILITDDISKNIQATQSHPMATKPHGDPKKSEAERANLMADKAPLEPDSFWCCCCCWTGRLYYSKWL
ncbi:unnamed protein product [Lampetra planeri]